MELQTNTYFSYLKCGLILCNGELFLELILSHRGLYYTQCHSAGLCVLESIKAVFKCIFAYWRTNVSLPIGEHSEVVASFNC